MEDALEKLQASLDRAAESIIPAKPDPEKAKEMAKRCISLPCGLKDSIL